MKQGDTIKTSHHITKGQAAFLKRKVEELKRLAPAGQEDKVTESTVLQGLLNLYMALDSGQEIEV